MGMKRLFLLIAAVFGIFLATMPQEADARPYRRYSYGHGYRGGYYRGYARPYRYYGGYRHSRYRPYAYRSYYGDPYFYGPAYYRPYGYYGRPGVTFSFGGY